MIECIGLDCICNKRLSGAIVALAPLYLFHMTNRTFQSRICWTGHKLEVSMGVSSEASTHHKHMFISIAGNAKEVAVDKVRYVVITKG